MNKNKTYSSKTDTVEVAVDVIANNGNTTQDVLNRFHEAVSNCNYTIANLDCLQDDELKKVIACISKFDDVRVFFEGRSKIMADTKHDILLVDICRLYVTLIDELGLPQKNRQDIQYVAVKCNDMLGVIVDVSEKKIVGLVDANDVDIVNAVGVSLSLNTSKNEEDEDCIAYRFSSGFYVFGVSEVLPLSHVIFCYHNGFFPSGVTDIHHINNACDNRVDMLAIPIPHKQHRANIPSSEKHISEVMAEIVKKSKITEDEFMDIIVRKALAERERICLKNKP